MGPRACALQEEKPPQWEARAMQLESSPCSLQLQKVCTQQQKPSVAKNNKQILKQKLLKLTINYSKVSKYKAKIRKSIIFLYAEWMKFEIKNTLLFTTTHLKNEIHRYKSNKICTRSIWGGFPGGLVVKNLPSNARDTSSIPGRGRFHMPQGN